MISKHNVGLLLNLRNITIFYLYNETFCIAIDSSIEDRYY